MNHLTPEQRAAFPMIMDDVMRMSAGRPAGDWRAAALAYRTSGHSYAAMILWLSQAIGCCGYRNPNGYGYDCMQQSLSADMRIRLPGQDWFALKRGAFLRFVLPDPTQPQQRSLF
jgi:hypothetical protein